MGTTYVEPVSLTALASEFKEQGINRAMILQCLVDNGYMVDIRTLGPKAAQLEISMQTNEKGSWPVYGNLARQTIIKNAAYIKTQYASLLEQPKPEKASKTTEAAKKKTNNLPKVEDVDESKRLPYLGLDNFVILDTETTSWGKTDQVIELSIVDQYGNPVYTSRFYTDVEINPSAQAVHHISNADLVGKSTFGQEWPKIASYLEGKTVIGHNIKTFDLRMIKQSLMATLNMSEDDAKAEVDRVIGDVVDSMDITKKYLKCDSYKIEALRQIFGITREESHSAEDDCVMTLEILEGLEEKLAFYAKYWK